MGDACNPHNLPATWAASHQVKGTDIFSEAERYKQMDGQQAAHYERFMADTWGVKSKSTKQRSVYDTIKKTSSSGVDPVTQVKEAKGIKGKLQATEAAGHRMFAHPSEQFSSTFWNPIDKKLSGWAKKGSNKKTYDTEVGKPCRTVLSAIDGIIKEGGTKNQLNTKLKKYGLTTDTIYDARKYLEWLGQGGHTKEGSPYLKPFRVLASNISKAQANWNIPWTLGNGADMLRVYSHYITQPGGFQAILQGTKNNLEAGFHIKQKKLSDMGLYDTQHMDTTKTALDPFSRSIIMQKNLVAHIELAKGGKPAEGIRKVLFDAKPWDQPAAYRNPDVGALVFGLARYPISETRYLYKTTKDAINGDKNAAANLLVYHVAKGAFLGTTSLIPAVVWNSMPKGLRDDWEKFDKEHNLNWVKIGSSAAFHKVGVKASIDLSDYTQPGGGTLGARAKSIMDNAQSAPKYAGKAVADLTQGKIPAAAAHTIAAGSAALNFLGFSQGVLKYVPKSSTVTKLLDTTGNILGQDMNEEKTKTQYIKAVFGDRNIKKAK